MMYASNPYKRPKTASQFILRGLLVPFSEENMLLAFKPSRFFYELSKVSGYSERTLRATYNRAVRTNLLALDGNTVPRLTQKGLIAVSPFVTKKLSQKGSLLVIFDIPEHKRAARDYFRHLLKRLGFKQIQLSVWQSDQDHRDIVSEAAREFDITDNVQIYEAAKIT